MVTPDYFYPDLHCFVDFFFNLGIEKLQAWPGIETTTLDLSSQSGVFID